MASLGKRRKTNVSSEKVACEMEKERRKGKPGCPLTRKTGHLLVGILAEDVLNDHNGFLNHIVDLGLDEIKQCAHTALCRLLCGKSGSVGTQFPTGLTSCQGQGA